MEAEFMNLDVVKYLKEKAPKVYSKVDDLYNLCESILSMIPKTFSNYTIHDIHHSIRVIGYMNDLVKDHLEQYSNLHIALMIYAGLLHDTGMFVSDDEKKAIYAEFETKIPAFREYSENEKLRCLQDYVRENHGRRVSTVIKNKINEDATIKSLFYVGKTNSYDISSIVAAICQAHMESSEWIKDSEYLNSACYENDDINPRQIAVLLRIGDYLDIDDRRAPYVLYSMLNPQGYSDGEWKKQIPITNYKKIEKNGDLYTITFSGKCSEPEIYRKVEDYIGDFQDQLAKDMQLCIDDFKLNIKLPVIKKIETDGFESTPLRFSLDYKQISKLLMGEQVYGNKKAGLRELLQNAIDAVLLMKEIEEKDPFSTYSPMVGIDFNKDANQITVVDNGIGMSEEVLSQFFFNIGNSYYESKGFNRNGYTYKPIGHFGIGFLACFMLSSKVTLETKHYDQDAKLIRMSFDKDSPYVIKYKDSRKRSISDHGTRIILDYNQVIPDVIEDEAHMKSYIKHLLRYDEIRFFVFHGKEKEEIKLDMPDKIFRNNKEIVGWHSTYTNWQPIMYSARKLFSPWNGNIVLLYDGTNVVNLAVIRHFFDELYGYDDYSMVKNVEYKNVTDKADKDISEYPFLKSIVHKCCRDMKSLNGNLLDIEELFDRCLAELLKTDHLTCHTFDCDTFIYNRVNIYNDDLENEMARRRMKFDSHSNRTNPKVVVICTDDSIEIDGIQEMIAHECDVHCSHSPRTQYIDLLRHNSTNQFIVIEKDKVESLPSIYIKGIYVAGEKNDYLEVPYQIRHIILGYYTFGDWYNFVNDRISMNVARNDFDDESKKEICNMIVCLAYLNCIKSERYSAVEKEMIERFLQTYYKETYEGIMQGEIIDTKQQ